MNNLDAQHPVQSFERYLAPGETFISRCNLHNTDGNSDKVYIVMITENPSTKIYRVIGFSGRRGSNLVFRDQGDFSDVYSARSKSNRVIAEKRNKGYQDVGTATRPAANPGQGGRKRTSYTIPTAQDCRLDHFVIGSIDMLDSVKNKRKIENILNSTESVIEPYLNTPSDMPSVELHYYVIYMHIETSTNVRGWHLYRMDTLEHMWSIEDNPDDGQYAEFQRGTVFSGYLRDDGKLALTDIYRLGELDNNDMGAVIVGRPWKARRAMLTQVYSQIFPTRDPYDTSQPAHLNEYVYEDKTDYAKNNNGLYIERGLNKTAVSQTVAFEYGTEASQDSKPSDRLRPLQELFGELEDATYEYLPDDPDYLQHSEEARADIDFVHKANPYTEAEYLETIERFADILEENFPDMADEDEQQRLRTILDNARAVERPVMN